MSPDTGPLDPGPLSLSAAAPAGDFPARAPQHLKVSFEFFPPKTEAMEKTLWDAVARLAPLNPAFFSVTYGAGGSTRQRTHDTVVHLKEKTGVDPAAHLLGDADRTVRPDVAVADVLRRGDQAGGVERRLRPHQIGHGNAALALGGEEARPGDVGHFPFGRHPRFKHIPRLRG